MTLQPPAIPARTGSASGVRSAVGVGVHANAGGPG